MTLFYFNHWAHVIVFVQFLLSFILNLRAISEYKGLVFGGAIYRRVFCVTSWRGGIFLEGLIFRILRYMVVINLPTNAALTMLNYC